MKHGSAVMNRPWNGRRRPQPDVLRIALLVGNECVRQGLTAMLRPAPLVDDVHIIDNTRTPALSADRPFDILILQFDDGVEREAVNRLAHEARRHDKKVLVLLNRDYEDMLDTVIAIPSDGFVVQEELTSAALVSAIMRLIEGDTPMPALLAGKLLSRARAGNVRTPPAGASLTPRERQVLELLVEGLSNKQIARRLRISPHGVKRHVSNVLAKLNCPNRTQAVAVALTDGILTEKPSSSTPDVPGWTFPQ
jgi:two-component system, NarL family, nitrate/nitrite response regulator NarL